MNTYAVRGRCPNAWHPMTAGDGLLVRVKPQLARVSAAQVMGLCEASLRFGNGLIDVTNRANLQIRGVTEERWPALLDRLIALELVDPDPVLEARRNILVAPDWQAGDDCQRIAEALRSRLDALPALPAKVGFAIDAGAAPLLRYDPADFRIERGECGGLILRAAGRENGVSIDVDEAVDAVIALAHWFVDSGGAAAGRMARHFAPLPGWALGNVRPAPARAPLRPGPHVLGFAYGVPFGCMEASALRALNEHSGARAVRLTPWRALLLEDALPARVDGFVHEAAHPAMRVEACPGAPACPQATVETRALAIGLAPRVSGRLHVSGCAKGCAHPGFTAVAVTGRDGRFDVAFDARPGDPPARSGLEPEQLLADLGAN